MTDGVKPARPDTPPQGRRREDRRRAGPEEEPEDDPGDDPEAEGEDG